MQQPAVLYGTYLSTAAVSATDSYTGTDAASVLTAVEDTYWRPANVSGDKTLTFDLREVRAVNRLCLLGEPLAGVQIDLRASSDNFAASDVEILAEETLATPVNAATLGFDAVSYRYWRLIFKDGFLPSPLRLAHVLLGSETVLPWLEEDFDPDTFEVSGEHLVSNGGLYLGSNVERAMRAFAISLGQVTTLEFASINPWAQACVGRAPFFFVPDKSAADCYFGWIKDKFSAPRQNGLHRVSPLTFMTRAA